jgi:hypothetical protein
MNEEVKKRGWGNESNEDGCEEEWKGEENQNKKQENCSFSLPGTERSSREEVRE